MKPQPEQKTPTQQRWMRQAELLTKLPAGQTAEGKALLAALRKAASK